MRVFLCAVWVMVFFSCGSHTTEFQNKDSLLSYMDDHKASFCKASTREGIKIEFEYIPTVLLEGNPDYLYFKLYVSYREKEFLAQLPTDQYSDMVTVFSFRMRDHIYIRGASDKVLPVDVFYTPTYGMSDKNELTVAFKRDDIANNTSSELDLVLDQPGLLTYTFTTQFHRKDLDFNPIISKT